MAALLDAFSLLEFMAGEEFARAPKQGSGGGREAGCGQRGNSEFDDARLFACRGDVSMPAALLWPPLAIRSRYTNHVRSPMAVLEMILPALGCFRAGKKNEQC
jgi:hypothetical protein